MFKKVLTLIAAAVIISIASAGKAVLAGEPWAPTSGYSSVNQEKAYNYFYFSNTVHPMGRIDNGCPKGRTGKKKKMTLVVFN